MKSTLTLCPRLQTTPVLRATPNTIHLELLYGPAATVSPAGARASGYSIPGGGSRGNGVTGHAGHTASYDHTPSIIDLVMDTPPYGYFISTRGESVETVGKNPVRTDGPVAPHASDVRTYERVRLTYGPTLPKTAGRYRAVSRGPPRRGASQGPGSAEAPRGPRGLCQCGVCLGGNQLGFYLRVFRGFLGGGDRKSVV